MDEPTNHLDIPSVRWLEQYLQNFEGAMVLVSHDRDFLNRQVNRIVSLEPEGLRSHRGNYDSYLKARQEETKAMEARQRNQEQKVKEAERFIERFRAKASKARQAQSKIKLLKKMDLVQTHRKQKTIHFSFPDVARSGRVVLSLEGLSKRFGDNILYENLNLSVLRGDRVALIGPNGSGKTTLLKMVAGELKPDSGKISLGHGVAPGYFAQHHSEALDLHKTVIEEVYQVVPDESVGFVRNVCGAFLFSGNEVEKPIRVLSGGEKARVSLAKLLVKPGNFMVMDEPTNHLDLFSSEKLIDALEQYDGTLLFVSHNQSFINRLATKVWDIQDRELVEYPGNLDEYYDHLARLEADGSVETAGASEGAAAGSAPVERGGDARSPEKRDRKAERRARAERRREIRETLDPLQSEVEELEEHIARLESRQQELERKLSDPKLFGDGGKSASLIREHGENREALEGLLQKWEHSHSRLEIAKRDLGL
jgi:ATP-binding cassette subfamily F protein 3